MSRASETSLSLSFSFAEYQIRVTRKLAGGNTCLRRCGDFEMPGCVIHICVQQSANLISGKYPSLSPNDRSINYPYWFFSREGNKSEPRCILGAEDKASSSCRIQLRGCCAGHSRESERERKNANEIVIYAYPRASYTGERVRLIHFNACTFFTFFPLINDIRIRNERIEIYMYMYRGEKCWE